MSHQLRYYQRDAKDAVEFGWEEDPRIGVKLPTGSGKTPFAAKLLADQLTNPSARCLYLADQDELVQQPRAVIQRWSGIIPSIEKAKERASLDARIVVASSQTLSKRKRLDRFPGNHFTHILSDEVHRGTDRDEQIWNHFEGSKVLGMTATPYKSNLANLSRWLSRMVYEMDILDLVEEGFAPPPFLLTLPIEINVEDIAIERGFEGKQYNAESVESTITPYFERIAETVRDNGKGRHGIAFLPLIKSSQAFAACLRHVGLRAHHIDGTTENRDAIMHAFTNGEIDWLTNSQLLTTGVDLPKCDAFLNLQLTSSRARYQQARGRAMRVLPGLIDHLPEKSQAAERRNLIEWSEKPNCLIFDLLLQNDRLGAVQAAEDFCKNPHDAKALFERSKVDRSPQEIAALAKAVQQEREAALVDALERAAIRSSLNSPMTGQQVAALIGESDFLDYIPVQRWEQEPASSQQLASLREKGVDTASIKSKGEASALLEIIFGRSRMGFCTIKQVKLIRQLEETKPENERTRDPERLSMADANAIIDAEFKARRRAVA